MLILLASLFLFLLAVSVLASYLWGANRHLSKIVRRQERGVRRLTRTVERWQDATLRSRGMPPVNTPLPQPTPPDTQITVARTPGEANQRYFQEKVAEGREKRNGLKALTDEQRERTLRAAEEMKPE